MGQLKSKRDDVLMNVNLSTNVRIDRKLKLTMLAVAYGMTSSQMLDQILEQVKPPDRFPEFQVELEAQVEQIPRVYSHDRKMSAHRIMDKLVARYKELMGEKQTEA